MLDQMQFVLTLVAALGCGLVAGVFFAFSAFVMKALSNLPIGQGIAAMQSINLTVLNPWFFGAFFGTAAACLVELVYSLLQWDEPSAIYLLFGSILYLVGCFLVTIVFNVPKNEALASLSPGDPDGESRWTGYVATWTAWNHVRTVAALAGATSFGIALGRVSSG